MRNLYIQLLSLSSQHNLLWWFQLTTWSMFMSSISWGWSATTWRRYTTHLTDKSRCNVVVWKHYWSQPTKVLYRELHCTSHVCWSIPPYILRPYAPFILRILLLHVSFGPSFCDEWAGLWWWAMVIAVCHDPTCLIFPPLQTIHVRVEWLQHPLNK